jgi:cardiolipin synthase
MSSVLTAANQLTLLRMLLVPVFALFMFYGEAGLALLTFTVAAATDALDGLIARWTGQVTTIGAWLDPMADKLLVATMFVMLTVPGLGLPQRLPLWLTVLVLSRDIVIVATVTVVNLAVARRTFRPSLLGKLATATYVLTGLAALYANYQGEASPIVAAFVYASLIVTLASGVHYVFLIFRAVHVERADPAGGPGASTD